MPKQLPCHICHPKLKETCERLNIQSQIPVTCGSFEMMAWDTKSGKEPCTKEYIPQKPHEIKYVSEISLDRDYRKVLAERTADDLQKLEKIRAIPVDTQHNLRKKIMAAALLVDVSIKQLVEAKLPQSQGRFYAIIRKSKG